MRFFPVHFPGVEMLETLFVLAIIWGIVAASNKFPEKE
jgi:hypothetical protein